MSILMNHARRWLSAALLLCLCLALLPSPAAAADDADILVIALDAGHGGRDPGASGTFNGVTYREREVTAKIADFLQEELEQYANVRVFQTIRTIGGTQEVTQPEDRVAYAVSQGAEVYISLHCNSANPGASGSLVCVPNSSYRYDIYQEAGALADCILAELSGLGLKNRGHYLRNDDTARYPDNTVADFFKGIRYSKLAGIPGIIVEHAFISNQSDCLTYFSTDEQIRRLAHADALGIAAHFGLTLASEMPEPEPEPDPFQFTDVKAADYFRASVEWALERGVTKGITDTLFGVGDDCTRAQAVTFLWRMAGAPAPQQTAQPYTDVGAVSYYEPAVRWAAASGIATDDGTGLFRPEDPCTRGEFVDFLWRYAGRPAVDSALRFSDVPADTELAAAVAWAAKAGVTQGVTATLFVPDGTCLREQCVTFLCRAANCIMT